MSIRYTPKAHTDYWHVARSCRHTDDMSIAITGGTGFVGRHLAQRYDADQVIVTSRRTGVSVDDVDALARAFKGAEEQIRNALPESGGFTWRDLRFAPTSHSAPGDRR
ncbi:hypothetical protein BAURA86_01875 [Brevibacterium aurantiacum]|uniref:NAD-dependent epimerase/dehydratase domain-containing protein n=2 Tax=Actinomycetes TaxID=1760 RepID=A0A2H1JN77_BREAU|nr:hypothetical protein BAURA86_01875 [Brevibacterium aurantiacum]